MRTFSNTLLAFIVAVTIWIYAKLSKEYSITYKIPVDYTIAVKGLTLLEGPDTVVATVVGDGMNILRFKLASPKLEYILDGTKIQGFLPIDISHLKPKLNVKIIPIMPKNIDYKLDEVEEKYLPVSPILKGEPRAGYFYLGWMVRENVLAEGPKTVLENLDSIPTYPIDITGKMRDFEIYAKIFTEGLNVKVKPESVRIRVLIDSLATKTVPVILKGSVIRVKVQGPARIIEPINSLKGETYNDSVYIPLPENVIIIK